MSGVERLQLDDVERRVCDIASEQLGIPRHKIKPSDRIIEDLNCDSLDLVELIIEVEEAFDVTLPEEPTNPIFKAVFTRQPFRLADLAELAYLMQGTGKPIRESWLRSQVEPPLPSSVPFTQLGGRLESQSLDGKSLWEPLETTGPAKQYRRRTDGMRCVLLPSAAVAIGTNAVDVQADERPGHVLPIDSYVIDAEPVSTTAYCRFLNSIGEVAPEILVDWFVLVPDDDRIVHMLVVRDESGWIPVAGTERWPMILVSWYGANAYSLWANGKDWRGYRGVPGTEPESFLPSEAQWEYAARGPHYRTFPWGDDPPADDRMRYGRHRRSAVYRADTMPMADVNAELGMSPFGLHHMAGNLWQLKERVDPLAVNAEISEFWTSAAIMAGLRFPWELIKHCFEGITAMRESSTIQAFIEEGRVKGKAEGVREIILRLGRKRCGAVTESAQAKLNAIVDLERLEDLAEHIDEASNWDELLAQS